MLAIILGRRARSLAGLAELAPDCRPPHVRLLASLTGVSSLAVLLGDY